MKKAKKINIPQSLKIYLGGEDTTQLHWACFYGDYQLAAMILDEEEG